MPVSLRSTMHQLYDAFISIYDQWTDSSVEAYARQMLEHDVLLLGSYFGTVDPIGQYAEFTLLAEAISELRIIQSPIKTDHMMDNMIISIMNEIKGQAQDYRLPVASTDAAEMIKQMKTVPLAEDLSERSLISQEQKKQLHNSMIALANLFVMRDGIVTDKELQAITDFEKLLAEATSSF